MSRRRGVRSRRRTCPRHICLRRTCLPVRSWPLRSARRAAQAAGASWSPLACSACSAWSAPHMPSAWSFIFSACSAYRAAAVFLCGLGGIAGRGGRVYGLAGRILDQAIACRQIDDSCLRGGQAEGAGGREGEHQRGGESGTGHGCSCGRWEGGDDSRAASVRDAAAHKPRFRRSRRSGTRPLPPGGLRRPGG